MCFGDIVKENVEELAQGPTKRSIREGEGVCPFIVSRLNYKEESIHSVFKHRCYSLVIEFYL